MSSGRPVFLVYEDELSGAVMERLVSEVRPQLKIDRSIITHGNSRLLAGIAKYVGASKAGIPHIILTDLDRGACAPELLEKWSVPMLEGRMLFRVAVREVESWVMADREGISQLLGVTIAKVPQRPDECNGPKEELLNLVRRCRRGKLKKDLLPAIGSSAGVGPLYNDILGRFTRTAWNIDRAAKRSPSLQKTILRLGVF